MREKKSRVNAAFFENKAHSVGFENATLDLVALDGLEPSLEVALTKAAITFTLDELEEDRAKGGLGEDLQQQGAVTILRSTIQENATLAKLFSWLTMVWKTALEHLVVSLWRSGHELGTAGFQSIPGLEQVVSQERDMLDANSGDSANRVHVLPSMLPVDRNQ